MQKQYLYSVSLLINSLTGLDINVEKDLPTSWKSMFGDGFGVRTIKTNLTGKGTSIELGIMIPSANLTRATAGLVRLSKAPTNTMVPSVSFLRRLRMDSFLLWAIR